MPCRQSAWCISLASWGFPHRLAARDICAHPAPTLHEQTQALCDSMKAEDALEDEGAVRSVAFFDHEEVRGKSCEERHRQGSGVMKCWVQQGGAL